MPEHFSIAGPFGGCGLSMVESDYSECDQDNPTLSVTFGKMAFLSFEFHSE